MTKAIAVVLGLYAVIAFAVGMIDLVDNLEEGLEAYDAFQDAIKTGLGWPISLVAFVW